MTLRKHTADDVRTRDRARGGCRVGAENNYHYCTAKAIDLLMRVCVPFVFHAPPTEHVSTEHVCLVCPSCLAAIRARQVGIAGNADTQLSITDARDDVDDRRARERTCAHVFQDTKFCIKCGWLPK